VCTQIKPITTNAVNSISEHLRKISVIAPHFDGVNVRSTPPQSDVDETKHILRNGTAEVFWVDRVAPPPTLSTRSPTTPVSLKLRHINKTPYDNVSKYDFANSATTSLSKQSTDSQPGEPLIVYDKAIDKSTTEPQLSPILAAHRQSWSRIHVLPVPIHDRNSGDSSL
jgi:hypothetical protein